MNEKPFYELFENVPKDKYREIADYFEVSESTVSRWARNLSQPAKLIQSQVITYLQKNNLL